MKQSNLKGKPLMTEDEIIRAIEAAKKFETIFVGGATGLSIYMSSAGPLWQYRYSPLGIATTKLGKWSDMTIAQAIWASKRIADEAKEALRKGTESEPEAPEEEVLETIKEVQEEAPEESEGVAEEETEEMDEETKEVAETSEETEEDFDATAYFWDQVRMILRARAQEYVDVLFDESADE